MKKTNQKNSSKETKLPSIQSNLQKGSVKQNVDSQEKLTQKTKNSNVPKIPNIPLTNKNIPNNITSSNKIKSEKNRKKITNNYKEEEKK